MALVAEVQASPILEWPEIYGRLRRDRGDAAAFAALEGHLLALARADIRRNGRYLAEDVAADTCAAVILSLDRARGPGTFKGYAIGIYLNTRRSYLRPPLSASLDGLEVAEDGERGPEHDELILLERCLSTLPPRDRSAVEMRYYEDAPYRAIAHALEITENNARQVVHAARLRLAANARRLWPAGRR